MEKKKERSSKQRMKVDMGPECGGEDGNLLLANPMAGGEVDPHTTLLPSDHSQPRASLQKKSRPKSPSLLRFFVRGTRKPSEDLEEAVGCASSDHEDGLSPPLSLPTQSNSQCSLTEHLSLCPTADTTALRFNRNVAAYVTLPRRKRRVEKRDSGFHSERSDSTSHDKEQLSISPEDMMQPLPVDRPVGMEALEALHNQIQILVKQDCPEEEIQVANLHDAVITSLRHQLDDMQQTLDFLRRSDHNLRLALRDAEHRALEAETKLFKSTERNQRLEHKLFMMAHKYQQLLVKGSSTHALPSNSSALKHHTASANKSAYYYSPQMQRVQREGPSQFSTAAVAGRQRPSSAQTTRDSISSVETCV